MKPHYKTVHVTPARGGHAEVECLNCLTTFGCELSEDGEPCPEMDPCADDECEAHVCHHCAKECLYCGLCFCEAHTFVVAGERLCRVCIQEEYACHLPEAV